MPNVSNSPSAAWNAYIDSWNRHDVEAILAHVTDDFIYDERPMTMTQPLVGKQAFRQYLEPLFARMPGFAIALKHTHESGHVGWSESEMTARIPISVAGIKLGVSQLQARVACAFEVYEGKLSMERLYWDKAGVLKSLGRLPSLLWAIHK